MQSKVSGSLPRKKSKPLPDINLEDLGLQDHLLVYLWFTFSEDVAFRLLFGSFVLPICKRKWEEGKNQVKMTHAFMSVTSPWLYSETTWCQVSCQEHDVGEWSLFFPHIQQALHCEFITQDRSVKTESFCNVLRCPREIIHCHYSHRHNHRSPPTVFDKRFCPFLQR